MILMRNVVNPKIDFDNLINEIEDELSKIKI